MSALAALLPRISDLALDVRAGLTKPGQKELPSKYLYDPLGSKLFEAICELPEYGVTRADERILRAHAHELADAIAEDVVVCELGSGSGAKTRWVLEALARNRFVAYYPIEISRMALTLCERELSDLRRVECLGLECEYLDGLRQVAARRGVGQQILVLFLGSTIGNFAHPADETFLRELKGILSPGDSLLLGTDLMKPSHQLLAAYDDPTGVTAAFNLNLLGRINRELDADFVLRRFQHVAKVNPKTSSVEMHLRSTVRQTVHIPGADLHVDFEKGESIWTENSHKYSLAEISQLAATAQFEIQQQWVDEEWPFAESLLVAM